MGVACGETALKPTKGTGVTARAEDRVAEGPGGAGCCDMHRHEDSQGVLWALGPRQPRAAASGDKGRPEGSTGPAPKQCPGVLGTLPGHGLVGCSSVLGSGAEVTQLGHS